MESKKIYTEVLSSHIPYKSQILHSDNILSELSTIKSDVENLKKSTSEILSAITMLYESQKNTDVHILDMSKHIYGLTDTCNTMNTHLNEVQIKLSQYEIDGDNSDVDEPNSDVISAASADIDF